MSAPPNRTGLAQTWPAPAAAQPDPCESRETGAPAHPPRTLELEPGGVDVLGRRVIVASPADAPAEEPVEFLWIVIGAIVVAAALWFFFANKKKEEDQLPPAAEPKKLPEKPKGEPAKATPAPKSTRPEAAKAPESAKRAGQAGGAAKEEEHDEVEVEEAPSLRPAAPSREAPAVSARKRDVMGLRKGLGKVREKEGLFGRLKSLFVGKKEIDPHVVEQMEEVLLTSDVGVKTTAALLEEIRDELSKNELADTDRVWDALRQRATRILGIGGGGIGLSAKPTVVMVVGVNGVGKTTSIGKLATKLKADGKKVVLAAGDTFRAAAVQQLGVWAKRVGCEVVSGKDGANPGAVIFDAIQKAKEIGADVVLADTAGRLHTKANLMEELKKVSRTMTKAMDGAPHEVLLVLDATNGQNAIQQTALFKEALPLSGIVLTKLDGTAKGGVILGICAEHGVPVRYIGIGERAEDLREFNADEFVEAMLGSGAESADAAA
jgi:fused signal recognition particle receptor